MFVVTKSGQRLEVNVPKDYKDKFIPFHETVGLYTNNTILKRVWVLELNHRDYFENKKDTELEFVKEIRYDHEPTKEDILWAMSAYGCTRGDIALVRHGYELDIDGD